MKKQIICGVCGTIEEVNAEEIKTVVFFPFRYTLTDGVKHTCPNCKEDETVLFGEYFISTLFGEKSGTPWNLDNIEKSNELYQVKKVLMMPVNSSKKTKKEMVDANI